MQTAEAIETVRGKGAVKRVVRVRGKQGLAAGKSHDDGSMIKISRLSAELNEIPKL